MTTLADRPNTALLVVDVQNGVMESSVDSEAVIAKVSALVDRARSQDAPVIWVQHSSENLPVDSEQWKYVPQLVPQEKEPVVHKRYGDAFEETELEQVLAARGVGRLFVVGAQTDACIRSTLHGAFVRGYDSVLVSDAHTTEDLSPYGAPAPDAVIAHTNLYWTYQTAPGRTAGTVKAAEVDFGASRA
ncbi:MAG TPA: isochorismatase family protein [Actinospica sp.]|nr:isochorismatase family protein [Actinospica sp.]